MSKFVFSYSDAPNFPSHPDIQVLVDSSLFSRSGNHCSLRIDSIRENRDNNINNTNNSNENKKSQKCMNSIEIQQHLIKSLKDDKNHPNCLFEYLISTKKDNILTAGKIFQTVNVYYSPPVTFTSTSNFRKYQAWRRSNVSAQTITPVKNTLLESLLLDELICKKEEITIKSSAFHSRKHLITCFNIPLIFKDLYYFDPVLNRVRTSLNLFDFCHAFIKSNREFTLDKYGILNKEVIEAFAPLAKKYETNSPVRVPTINGVKIWSICEEQDCHDQEEKDHQEENEIKKNEKDDTSISFKNDMDVHDESISFLSSIPCQLSSFYPSFKKKWIKPLFITQIMLKPFQNKKKLFLDVMSMTRCYHYEALKQLKNQGFNDYQYTIQQINDSTLRSKLYDQDIYNRPWLNYNHLKPIDEFRVRKDPFDFWNAIHSMFAFFTCLKEQFNWRIEQTMITEHPLSGEHGLKHYFRQDNDRTMFYFKFGMGMDVESRYDSFRDMNGMSHNYDINQDSVFMLILVCSALMYTYGQIFSLRIPVNRQNVKLLNYIGKNIIEDYGQMYILLYPTRFESTKVIIESFDRIRSFSLQEIIGETNLLDDKFCYEKVISKVHQSLFEDVDTIKKWYEG